MGKVIVANPKDLVGAAAAIDRQNLDVAAIAGEAVTSIVDGDNLIAALAPRRAADVLARVGALAVGGGDSLAGIGIGMGVDVLELGLAGAGIAVADAMQVLTTPVETVQLSSNAADNVVARTDVLSGEISGKYIVGTVKFQGEIKLETLANRQVRVTLAATGTAGIDAEVLKAAGGVGGSAGWVVANQEAAERLIAQLAVAGAGGAGLAALRRLVGNRTRIPDPQVTSRSITGSAGYNAGGRKGSVEMQARWTDNNSVRGGRDELAVTVTGTAGETRDGRRPAVPGVPRGAGVSAAAEAADAISVNVSRRSDGTVDSVSVGSQQSVGVNADGSLAGRQRGPAVVNIEGGTRRRVVRSTTVPIPAGAAPGAARTIEAAVASGNPARVRDAVGALRDLSRRGGGRQVTEVRDVSEQRAGVGVDVNRAGFGVEGSIRRENLVSRSGG